MKIQKQLLYGHVTTLFLGGLIYFLFRSEQLIMFQWFDFFELPLQNIRVLTLGFGRNLPDWFVFSLPDGLWIFSYITLILLIWRNKINRQNIIWIAITPLLALVFEIGQYINIVQGTFDFYDILFYIVGAILPVGLYTELIDFKILNYEKSK
jgi:hypothetical protein